VAVSDIRERWRTSFIEASTHDWAVEHEHVAGVLGRLIWGTDTATFNATSPGSQSCRPAQRPRHPVRWRRRFPPPAAEQALRYVAARTFRR
jgi:hypothetical protein